MKILPTSDFHFEVKGNGGEIDFIKSLPKADVIVVAGDLTMASKLQSTLGLLASYYPDVVYVCGNHEDYMHEAEYCLKNIRPNVPKNVHWLENSSVVINGTKFIGCTLWFEADEFSVLAEKKFSDFVYIKKLSSFAYVANMESLEFLRENAGPDTIVVTHHLPCSASIGKQWVNDEFNRFYLSPSAEKIIKDKKPKLWIHGHSHCFFDYEAYSTRIVCNPRGYVIRNENGFRKDLILECSTTTGVD